MNKPGCDVDDLKGGVAGGSILQGVLRVGQEIEVRPGIVTKDSNGKMMCKPIFSKVLSLCTEQNDLMYAVPGGLIGEYGLHSNVSSRLKEILEDGNCLPCAEGMTFR